MPYETFLDRVDAGRRLGQALVRFRRDRPVVLALPRGGVPVGWEVAKALEAPLDVLLVRKIGVPWQPELALGAVVEGDPPEAVFNDEILRLLPVPRDYLAEERDRLAVEIERRRRLYTGGRAPVPVAGRTVVVVDDGIATGSSVRAALMALRRRGPKRVVLAVPVAPEDAVRRLEAECDDIVVLTIPRAFHAVGMYYGDFTQTGDREVVEILKAAAGGAPSPEGPLLEKVRRALAAEPRLDLAGHPVQLSLDGNRLVLAGEMASVTAKRAAVERAAAVEGVGEVVDRLTVTPARAVDDAVLQDEACEAVYREPQLAHHAIYLLDGGRRLTIRCPADAVGEIAVAVEDGAVILKGVCESLQAKRLAGAAAWRAAGTRDVVNELAVRSADDSDDAVAEAVRLAWERDPSVDAGHFRASARAGVVRIDGRAETDAEADRAESDAWTVFGVEHVHNATRVGH